MSVDNSLRALTEELVLVTWPAFVCFAGAQVAVVRRVMLRAGTPDGRLVAAAWVTALGTGAAMLLAIATAPHFAPQDEPEFSQVAFLWWLFAMTMWPVFSVFVVAELLLVVRAGSRSVGVVTGVLLAAGLTATWMMQWWIYRTPLNEVLRNLLRWPWVIGLWACAFGFALSTATWLSARRMAVARRTP
jgi:hypothetical protein